MDLLPNISGNSQINTIEEEAKHGITEIVGYAANLSLADRTAFLNYLQALTGK